MLDGLLRATRRPALRPCRRDFGGLAVILDHAAQRAQESALALASIRRGRNRVVAPRSPTAGVDGGPAGAWTPRRKRRRVATMPASASRHDHARRHSGHTLPPLDTLCRATRRRLGQVSPGAGPCDRRIRVQDRPCTSSSISATTACDSASSVPSSAPRSEHAGRLTAASRMHLLQGRALPTDRRTPARRSRSKPGLDCPRPEKWRSVMHPGQDAAGASHPSFKTPDPRREFGGPGAPALRVDAGP